MSSDHDTSPKEQLSSGVNSPQKQLTYDQFKNSLQRNQQKLESQGLTENVQAKRNYAKRTMRLLRNFLKAPTEESSKKQIENQRKLLKEPIPQKDPNLPKAKGQQRKISFSSSPNKKQESDNAIDFGQQKYEEEFKNYPLKKEFSVLDKTPRFKLPHIPQLSNRFSSQNISGIKGTKANIDFNVETSREVNPLDESNEINKDTLQNNFVAGQICNSLNTALEVFNLQAQNDKIYAQKDKQYEEKDKQYEAREQYYKEREQYYKERDKWYFEQDQSYLEIDNNISEKEKEIIINKQAIGHLTDYLNQQTEKTQNLQSDLDKQKNEYQILLDAFKRVQSCATDELKRILER